MNQINQTIHPNMGFYQNQRPEKHQLMKTIYESGFAVYDAVLFLDTHPCDKEALAYYQKMKQIYDQASKEYSSLYGPLRINQIDNDQYWSWSEGPWPWEIGGC